MIPSQPVGQGQSPGTGDPAGIPGRGSDPPVQALRVAYRDPRRRFHQESLYTSSSPPDKIVETGKLAGGIAGLISILVVGSRSREGHRGRRAASSSRKSF